MEQKKLSLDKIVIAIILIAFVAIVVIAFVSKKSGISKVDGTYTIEYAAAASDGSGDSTAVTVSMDFDSKKGKFTEKWNDSVFSTGEYSVDENNRITVKTDATDTYASETLYFLLDDDFIVPEAYMYEGELPEGNSFSTEFKLEDANSVTMVTFTDDNHFTVAVTSETNNSTVTGTYERDGKYINRVRDDGTPLTPFYVFDGNKLAGVVYQKK